MAARRRSMRSLDKQRSPRHKALHAEKILKSRFGVPDFSNQSRFFYEAMRQAGYVPFARPEELSNEKRCPILAFSVTDWSSSGGNARGNVEGGKYTGRLRRGLIQQPIFHLIRLDARGRYCPFNCPGGNPKPFPD